MLTRVDRMQLAVRDRAQAAETFRDFFGAEQVREDASALLRARRAVVQAGVSEFELLEPDGEGPVQAHLERWGEGIFAAGFATTDLSALCDRLTGKGIVWREEGGRAFVEADQAPAPCVIWDEGIDADREVRRRTGLERRERPLVELAVSALVGERHRDALAVRPVERRDEVRERRGAGSGERMPERHVDRAAECDVRLRRRLTSRSLLGRAAGGDEREREEERGAAAHAHHSLAG
jgi:hypothetical protein